MELNLSVTINLTASMVRQVGAPEVTEGFIALQALPVFRILLLLVFRRKSFGISRNHGLK